MDNSGNNFPNTIQGDLFAYKLDYETAGHFDGNIGSQKWHDGQSQRTYNYTYDTSQRLKTANYVGVGAESYDLPNINYDANGNILNMQRNGKLGANSFGLMDNLTYVYSGNMLNAVQDAISTNNEVDFVPRGNNAYTYYSNGALKSDANEQIANIVYNTYLNQPSEVFLMDGRKIKHYYDGGGALFKTEYFNAANAIIETFHYIDGIIYKNGTFYQVGIPEGRALFSNGTWQYEFDYKDHLGNTRASFKAENNVLIRTAQTDFDPFGVILKSSQANSFANRFELQGKERDLTFGLNWINFGARRMNPTTGRMDNIDAMASKFVSHSLYNYALNSPLNVIDPDGNESRDVRPDDKAFKAIINGLTAEDSKVVKLDLKGFIDKSLINSQKSESGNFNALKQLVNDKRVFDIKISDNFNYKDNKGQIKNQKMEAVSYTDFLTGEKLKEVEGFLGYTAIPGSDDQVNSTNSEIQITLNKTLNNLDQSKLIGHEAYGHAYLFSQGKEFGHKATVVGSKRIDANTVLKNQIKNRINETINNFRNKN